MWGSTCIFFQFLTFVLLISVSSSLQSYLCAMECFHTESPHSLPTAYSLAVPHPRWLPSPFPSPHTQVSGIEQALTDILSNMTCPTSELTLARLSPGVARCLGWRCRVLELSSGGGQSQNSSEHAHVSRAHSELVAALVLARNFISCLE